MAVTVYGRLRRLERLVWVAIGLAVASMLVSVARGQTASQLAAATADYQAAKAAGIETRYLWFAGAPTPEAVQVCQYVALLASRTSLLDEAMPLAMPDGLVRLSLPGLGWTVDDWRAVWADNPYRPIDNPLMLHAGYFVDRVLDGSKSDTYYRLVFSGDKKPDTAKEFLAAFGIEQAKQGGLQQGWVEGRSAVNVNPNGSRLVTQLDGIHTFAWVTQDVRAVDGDDPLEQLGPVVRHDASEIFVLRPLVSTRGLRGLMPVTALADGSGKLVGVAPADIVQDSTLAIGRAEIVNPIGCVSCHTKGSQRPSVNALKERLLAGVELLATGERKVEIELMHLGDVHQNLDAWDAGYKDAVLAINGMTTEANSAAVVSFVRAYRADVTPEQAAADIGCTVEQLTLALGSASSKGLDIGVRLSGLAHGIPVPRTSWESRFVVAKAIVASYVSEVAP